MVDGSLPLYSVTDDERSSSVQQSSSTSYCSSADVQTGTAAKNGSTVETMRHTRNINKLIGMTALFWQSSSTLCSVESDAMLFNAVVFG